MAALVMTTGHWPKWLQSGAGPGAHDYWVSDDQGRTRPGHQLVRRLRSLRRTFRLTLNPGFRLCGMSDAATVSAVMRELAARRWRGQVPARLARELVLRVDELPEVERRQLLDALTAPHTGQERSP
jgi:hypothetical protein